MNTLKKAALFALSIVSFGFILFSFATISVTVFSIAGVLIVAGFLARPLLPKGPRKPVTIDATATAST